MGQQGSRSYLWCGFWLLTPEHWLTRWWKRLHFLWCKKEWKEQCWRFSFLCQIICLKTNVTLWSCDRCVTGAIGRKMMKSSLQIALNIHLHMLTTCCAFQARFWKKISGWLSVKFTNYFFFFCFHFPRVKDLVFEKMTLTHHTPWRNTAWNFSRQR